MASRRLLYRVGAGRYVVAPRGTFASEQAAPIEALVDIELRKQGDYYLSFLTGLIDHRLTDLHSSDLYVAIRQSSNYRRREREIEGRRLHAVRLSDAHWPNDDEIEQLRVLERAEEFSWRATLERTLIDALARPAESGGIETVVGAWARARRANTDWDRVAQIADRQGTSMRRRAAFLLNLLGFQALVDRHFVTLAGRGAAVPLDRSRSFPADGWTPKRDRETGVLINVPLDHLSGWIAASALG
jgi:predicted transcriptional regulator of viral defense system